MITFSALVDDGAVEVLRGKVAWGGNLLWWGNILGLLTNSSIVIGAHPLLVITRVLTPNSLLVTCVLLC